MHASWVKETTTTTGTGNIALSAVSGFARFSQAFPAGVPVPYAIITSDGKFESGIGTVTAGNILARTKVIATWDGSTYNDASATALALVAGTHTVICTIVGENALASPLGVGPGVSPAYLISATQCGSSQTNVNAIATNVATFYPFLLLAGVKITGLAANVSVAGGAGSTFDIGLYLTDSIGYPGKQLAVASGMDAATTGFKVGSVGPSYLNPGWYLIGWHVTDTAIKLTGTSKAYCSNGLFGINGSDQPTALRANFTAWGDPFPTVTPSTYAYDVPNLALEV